MKRLFAAALLGLMTAASAHAQVPGGGGITIVTDTSANTVNGPYKLLINGGTVSNPSSGVAEITISGGGTGCTPAGGQTTNIVLYGADGLCTPALDANITNGDLSLGLVNSAGGTLDLFGSSSGKATITGGTNGTFTSASPWALSGVLTLTGASNALGTPLTLVGTNITGTAAGLTAGVANGLNSATTTVVVNAATAPTNGQVLTATSGTAAGWATPSAGGSGANPTATAGPAAVNGSAPTFLRSDGAPAVQKGSAAQFGIMECDNITVTCPGGVLSSVGGAATTITPGTTTVVGATAPCVIENSATTVMACTAETGTGNFVRATSPTIASPTITGAFTATGLVTAADLFGTTGSAGNVVLATSPTLVTPNLGTPSTLNCTNCTAYPKGSNSVFGVVEVDNQTIVATAGVISGSAPNRKATTSPAVLSTDMGGQIVSNVSGGGTLTIPAIGAGVFGLGQSLSVVNYSASTEAVSTTPTVNAGGGCVTATGIPSGDTWQIYPDADGTTLDCFQTVSSIGGSGTVTSASVVSTNGFAGTVATATTTPAITISTSVTGITKGNGTALSAATAGTDYVAPGTATSFTAPQTFAEVLGATNATGTSGTICRQGATTCTLLATDCGTTVIFANGSSAVTVTIPASIVPASGTSCIITVIEGGTAKVSVNGSAVSAATLVSASSYTGTRAAAGAAITLTLATVASTATAYLTGDGS